jgi:transposase
MKRVTSKAEKPMTTENKEKIKLLKDFLKNRPDGREIQRALAVKLVLEGDRYQAVKEILSVSLGFISKWVNAFNFGGIDALRSGYKGSKSYLTNSERAEVIEWLIEQKAWDVSELEIHLIEKYDVVYQSLQTLQSYDQILQEAQISWQKGQQVNPRYNEEVTGKKNREIAEILENRREEIESGKLIVYIVDECHLHWDDICGYLWNLIKEPLKIPLLNPKERQTYYGALNLLTQEFILLPYQQGNGENTIDFVQQLQRKNPEAKTLWIWDGASYHRGKEMQEFLAKENQDLSSEDWRVTCCLFAPYSPQENPVEAIWLQLKTLLRRFYRFGKSFTIVKRLFQLFVDWKLFNLPNLKNYDAFSRFI